MKKHRKLQSTVMLSFMVLAIVLILIISLVVGDRYIRNEMENCRTTAYTYTKSAAEMIDGDKIAGYVETGKKDEYYYEVLHFLNAFRLNTDIQYFYVFVPCEEDLVYIWDANALKADETEIDACDLGYREEYMDGGKEVALSVFKQNPPEEIDLFNDETYGYIATATSPIFDSNGNPVAIVGVDVYMPDLQDNMRQFLVVVIVAIMLVVTAAILLCFVFVKRKIVNPINTIRDVSKTMVDNLENEESIQVTVQTGNEIEELFDSFKQMYGDVKEYIRRLSTVTAEKERIGAELDVAAHIQASMLPGVFPAFPDRTEFDIYATMDPAKEVGGDFYDFFMVDERHLAIVMADVSGKGVPAALFMVIGKTLIKDHTTPGRDLGKVFTEVNNLLCEANSEGLFITAFEGVLDLVTGEFTYVNAGHEMPFICKAGGDFVAHKIRAAFVLAGMEDMRYRAGSMILEPGDKVFQYTDGVTEATNIHNELYGMSRLGTILNKVKDGNPHQILPAVKADVDAFVGEAPQFDDITMLCLEYKSRMEQKEDA
jgi:sigma-B regulation protein RsbU (phosphoserine phosphatase)